ncbi:MAG: hypothetical protein AB7I32_12855 [Gammaproteobacteria bacterium]
MPAARGRLTLVLPGYARGVADGAAPAPTPALRRLLARAQWTEDHRSTTQALLEAFGLPPDCALAALLARAELGVDAPGWLRADPVHFRADAKLVMLVAPAADELTADEADALLDELRSRLPEFTWRRGAEARHWYVRMPLVDATPSLGPAWLHGRSLTPFFPQDPAYRRWRQAMTEAQMVMHDAALNAAREARGALPLNALWIWGGGRPPLATSSTLALAVGRDPLLAGMAAIAGVAHAPACAAERLAAALAQGPVLLLAGTPFGAGDESAVLDDANAGAALAWSALRRGQAAAIEVVGEGLRGRVTRGARWRLWQRRMPGGFGDCHAVAAP